MTPTATLRAWAADAVRRGEDRHAPLTGPVRLLIALPWLLMAVGSAIEMFAPAPVTGIPLLAAAPFAAAAFQPLVPTLLVGLVDLVLSAVLLAYYHDVATALGSEDIYALIALVAISLVICQVRRAREAQVAGLRAVAEAAQVGVLPDPGGAQGPVRVATRYDPAGSDALVGGDLFGAEVVGGAARILIGDVRGKGLRAIAVVAGLVGAFGEAAHYASGLPDLAERMERSAQRGKGKDPVGDGADERFATALLVEVDRDGRTLRTVSCGHPDPLVVRASGGVEVLEAVERRPPLGLGDLVPGRARARTDRLEPGDVLVLFTDGLVEARDAGGRFFDAAAWLAARPPLGGDGGARALAEAELERLLTELAAAARRHSGGRLEDDLALMAVTPSTR